MELFRTGRKDGTVPRIVNPKAGPRRGDFSFSIYSFIFMALVASAGAAVAGLAFGGLQPAALIRGFAGLALVALVYALYPSWNALLYALLIQASALFAATGLRGEWALLGYEPGRAELAFIIGLLVAAVVGPSLQVVSHWDKALVLRLGRFHRVKGPGPFLLAPLADRCAAVVDTRIRVTDFSAERILTRDTVPIHVDALAFWMIWDVQKAILEVEDYLEAVTLSAQTALRDSVGKYSLSTLLSERETLYREIQGILDAKTNPWGITILSVEFVDIQLPKDLEDVMSRQAQAEREREARILLADAEREVARSFVEAAEAYRGKPEALSLRGMNMVYDAVKERGSMVLVPSGALQGMNLGPALAAVAVAREPGTPGAGAPDEGTNPGSAKD